MPKVFCSHVAEEGCLRDPPIRQRAGSPCLAKQIFMEAKRPPASPQDHRSQPAASPLAKQFFLEAKRPPAIPDRRSSKFFYICPRLAEEGRSYSPATSVSTATRALSRNWLGRGTSTPGFFDHPVLVFSNPEDRDYVRVFPMTSYGNQNGPGSTTLRRERNASTSSRKSNTPASPHRVIQPSCAWAPVSICRSAPTSA